MLFTGVNDTDREILLRTSLDTLKTLHLVNRHANSLLSPSFWRQRFLQEHGVVEPPDEPQDYRSGLFALQSRTMQEKINYTGKKGFCLLLRSLFLLNTNLLTDKAFLRHHIDLLLSHNQPQSLKTVFSLIPSSQHEEQILDSLWSGRGYTYQREGMSALIQASLDLPSFDYARKDHLCFRIAVKHALTDQVGQILNRKTVDQTNRRDGLLWLIRYGRYETPEDRAAVLSTLKVLLDNQTETDGPYMSWAASRGMLEVVEALWKAGYSLNVDGEAPLRRAAEGGYLNVIQFIVENSEPTEIDLQADRNYAIIYARNRGHLDVANYLKEKMIEQGLDPDLYRSNRPGKQTYWY